MNLNKVRELYISKGLIELSNESLREQLDYDRWKRYIDTSSEYIWFEDTRDGVEIKSKISTIPIEFRNAFVSMFNYHSCCAEWNSQKKRYDIDINFHEKLKYITISFEKKVTVSDLKSFLNMANYLDAFLLYRGKKIIDDKLIDELEKQQIEKKKKNKP